jgi:hypothetical protein
MAAALTSLTLLALLGGALAVTPAPPLTGVLVATLVEATSHPSSIVVAA